MQTDMTNCSNLLTKPLADSGTETAVSFVIHLIRILK